MNINQLHIYSVLLLPNVYVGLPYEYSPVPAITAVIFIFWYLRKGYFDKFSMYLLSSIVLLLPVSFLNFNVTDFIKDLAFLFLFTSGVIFASNPQYWKIFNKVLLYRVLTLFCIIVCIQVSNFGKVLDPILIRQFERGTFGVSGMYGEPSFFALGMFSLMSIYFIVNLEHKRELSKGFFVITNISVFSGSSVLLFQYLLTFLFSKRKILFLVSILSVIVIIITFNDINIMRFLRVIIDVTNEGLKFLLTDGSLGPRFNYVIRDMQLLIQDFGSIYGYGTYNSIVLRTNITDYFPPNFYYDPYMSGSLLGRYLVQLNFIALIPVVYVLFKSFRVPIKITILLFLYLFLAIQMISTLFSPFVFSFGFVCGRIIYKDFGTLRS